MPPTAKTKPLYSGLQPFTTQDMSKVLAISTNAIGELVKRAVLVRVGRGLFDPAVAIPSYIRHQADALRSRWAVDADGRKRLILAKAAAAELALAKERGDLIQADLVDEAFVAAATHTREKLRALPTRLAPRLIDIDSPVQVEQILREAIDEALNELSRTRVQS